MMIWCWAPPLLLALQHGSGQGLLPPTFSSQYPWRENFFKANCICLTFLPCGPWALTVGTTPYSVASLWLLEEPRILRTRKPWRTSLQKPLVVQEGRCSSWAVFTISLSFPYLIPFSWILAMDSVALRVLGPKS